MQYWEAKRKRKYIEEILSNKPNQRFNLPQLDATDGGEFIGSEALDTVDLILYAQLRDLVDKYPERYTHKLDYLVYRKPCTTLTTSIKEVDKSVVLVYPQNTQTIQQLYVDPLTGYQEYLTLICCPITEAAYYALGSGIIYYGEALINLGFEVAKGELELGCYYIDLAAQPTADNVITYEVTE